MEQDVEVRDFNSYGSRRGNHEVMMRGTFANVRLRNQLVDREGGWTRHMPSDEEMSIYDAAMKYADDGVPLVVLAGKEYGSGSSRDWAAKGTLLLGVRAVIAESYERIHRSNLIGMGVLPLQFPDGESIESLGLTGEEEFTVGELNVDESTSIGVTATRDGGDPIEFEARVRLDTFNERQYFRHGGILPGCSASSSSAMDKRRIALRLFIGNDGEERRFHKARSRSVPPPGAIASASLPGYRRAGWGAGRVDPLPPAAPPQPSFFAGWEPLARRHRPARGPYGRDAETLL